MCMTSPGRYECSQVSNHEIEIVLLPERVTDQA